MSGYVRVRFTSGRVYLDHQSGRSARATLDLCGATSPARVAELGAVRAAVAVVGTRPLSTVDELTVWPGVSKDELERAIRSVISGFRLLGVVAPRQIDRDRLMALGRASGTDIVVKLAGDATAVDREAAALSQLSRRPLPTIRTATLIGHGCATVRDQPVHLVASEHLGGARQRPAWQAPLGLLDRHLAERLSFLPQPFGTPVHWVPQHGDLSPWNLRRAARGLALFDWEASGWYPPGVDLGYFGACVAAMGKGPAPMVPDEAREHLIGFLTGRSSGGGSIDGAVVRILTARTV